MQARLIVAFLIALPIVGGCSRDEPTTTERLRPVRAQQVFLEGGQRTRSFSGVARAGVESRLSFRVAGSVLRVAVKVGDRVRAGQTIAELDPADYRLQLQDAEASLNQATAQERRTTSDYERVRGLYENRNASKQDLDGARTAQESAQAGVASAEKRLELARNQVRYTRLIAPGDGSVASCDMEPNENVQAGQAVALLTSDAEIEVEVAIPEILISGIREGDAATVSFDALPNKTFAGRLAEVGVAAVGMATTYPVTVRLAGNTEELRSGMAAEVDLEFGSDSDRQRVVLLPVAVTEDRTGRFVFVVAPGTEPGVGVIERRAVTVGELTSEGLEIYDGVLDGDYVVTAGISKLVDGQRVRFDVDGSQP